MSTPTDIRRQLRSLLLHYFGTTDPALLAELWEERARADDLNALRLDVLAWQAATFPHRTIRSITAHLAKEGAELYDEPGEAMEHADVRFLAWAALDEADRLAERYHLDVLAACRAKLAINRARTWGKPDELGVVLHEKDGAE